LSIPDHIVSSVISEIMSRAGAILDTLQPNIKRNNPELSQIIFDDIERAIVDCQNEMADIDLKMKGIIDDIVRAAETKVS
jgi:phage terminase Nu1 subunit (DNA packaging protein)